MIKGKDVENWTPYLGCLCWFGPNGMLQIIGSGKVFSMQRISTEMMVTGIKDNGVLISTRDANTAYVEKKFIEVYDPTIEDARYPYRHLLKLKKLGFPQYGLGTTRVRNIGTTEEFSVYDPTLAELFAFTGATPISLVPDETHWTAVALDTHTVGEGDTRKDALIALIINLNSK